MKRAALVGARPLQQRQKGARNGVGKRKIACEYRHIRNTRSKSAVHGQDVIACRRSCTRMQGVWPNTSWSQTTLLFDHSRTRDLRQNSILITYTISCLPSIARQDYPFLEIQSGFIPRSLNCNVLQFISLSLEYATSLHDINEAWGISPKCMR